MFGARSENRRHGQPLTFYQSTTIPSKLFSKMTKKHGTNVCLTSLADEREVSKVIGSFSRRCTSMSISVLLRNSIINQLTKHLCNRVEILIHSQEIFLFFFHRRSQKRRKYFFIFKDIHANSYKTKTMNEEIRRREFKEKFMHLTTRDFLRHNRSEREEGETRTASEIEKNVA